jgi:enamine deaminase RidA (YjgF/YER057c/UK114 family)
MAQLINPADLAPPRGFSHGALAPPGRRLLAVAGQIGWDREGRLVAGGFAEQFAQALANVAAVVREAGGRPEDVLSLRIYVTDKRRYLAELKAVGAAYRAVLGKHYPAMALVQVADLLEDGALVEIEALAAIVQEDA